MNFQQKVRELCLPADGSQLKQNLFSSVKFERLSKFFMNKIFKCFKLIIFRLRQGQEQGQGQGYRDKDRD